MIAPLRELRSLIKRRLEEARDRIGINLAAMKAISRFANERKNAYNIEETRTSDIWSGLGLGSDVAAALQSRGTKRQKR